MPRPAGRNSTVLTTPLELLDDGGKPLTREAVLRRAFGDSYTVQEIDVTAEVVTHLDTAARVSSSRVARSAGQRSSPAFRMVRCGT